MTDLFDTLPRPEKRSATDFLVSVTCIVAVGVGILVGPVVGKCGTGHYFIFQALAAMLVSPIALLWSSRLLVAGQQILAYVLNLTVFVLIVRAWYRKASEGRFVLGVILLTGAYLLSFFLLLPGDCP